MTKCIALTAVVLLLASCSNSETDAVYEYEKPVASRGEFLVAQEDLPLEIVELARVLGRLPNISSDAEFRSLLVKSGLNKNPDHYKDGGHFWYLDEAFRSEKDLQKRKYRISIGHFPVGESEIMFYAASIERVFPSEPWREWLWKIEWAIEPVN